MSRFSRQGAPVAFSSIDVWSSEYLPVYGVTALGEAMGNMATRPEMGDGVSVVAETA